MDYKLIFSDRKTVSLTVKNGEITVRAPKKMPHSAIENFIKSHASWIEKALEREKIRSERHQLPSEAEVKKLKKAAKIYLTDKTNYFANIMGLKCGRITITSAKTRFGSCSSKGNISYSYLLMLYPEAAREYVVVHELAHLKEMNHSKRFYKIIEEILPDYKERRRMLK